MWCNHILKYINIDQFIIVIIKCSQIIISV